MQQLSSLITCGAHGNGNDQFIFKPGTLSGHQGHCLPSFVAFLQLCSVKWCFPRFQVQVSIAF